MDILIDFIPNVVKYADQFPKAVLDTLLMLLYSGVISLVIGLVFGVIVVVTRKGGILENKVVFFILDKIINLFRSIPFMARQMESAMMEIDDGIVEAAISMGMSPMQIILHVYLRENVPGMIRGITITLIALIGQIAIVGAVGAGGLGDMAIRYGQRYMYDITYTVVILILIIISIIQSIGNKLVEKTTH